MRIPLCLLGLLATGLITTRAAAAHPPLSVTSLCELQTKVAEGDHENVRVEGVFLPGLETQGGLVNAGCSGRSTRVELALKTHKNWRKLQQMSDKRDELLVVFEGEFYGPPEPDPNLPEAIRKNYHPGWDYNSMTKLVVQAIQSVEPLPANHPCASSPTQKWPCFQHDPASHNGSTGAGLDQQTLGRVSRPLRVALDKNEGVVKQHLCTAMPFRTPSTSKLAENRSSGYLTANQFQVKPFHQPSHWQIASKPGNPGTDGTFSDKFSEWLDWLVSLSPTFPTMSLRGATPGSSS